VNFRTAAQQLAGSLSSDDAMDSSQSLGNDADPTAAPVQLDPQGDGQDPATPGGPSPFNGAGPFGEPVATDPEWRDPQEGPRSRGPVPFTPGPHVDSTTIHNARRASYQQRNSRA
jgi:hypothetical protein